MRNGFVFLVMIIFLVDFQGLYAQMETPKGKVEVVAVKGKVIFEGKALKKEETLGFAPNISAVNQLDFGSSTDWVKVKEIGTGKIYSFYKQKRYACSNCLGTRDAGDAPKALSGYFGRKTVFLFEPDTLITIGTKNSNTRSLAVFKIFLDDKVYSRIVGDDDTIIISNDRVYGFAKEEKIRWPSFQADSLRLVYCNKDTYEETIPQLPVFNVIFFEDAVSYLLQMGLSADEIYNELTENYMELKAVATYEKFESSHEAEQWLRLKINKQIKSR